MQNMEKIYQEYSETVYKYLFCLTSDADLAEDLTQETFLKLIKYIGSYKDKGKMKQRKEKLEVYVRYHFRTRSKIKSLCAQGGSGEGGT